MRNCWTRKKWLRIDVAQGCLVPHWYGIAYMDYVSLHVVCYPIPFNLLVNWGQKLYHGICFPNVVSGDYARGFHDGMMANLHTVHQEGYEKGLKDGRKQKEGPTSIH